jgi:signal transduction histidine kinase
VEKALQEANSSLNLLNSITRHDVLNQLMIIRGYSDLVRASMKDQKLLDYMDKVERATRNIRQQILFTRDFQKLGMVEAKWQSAEELIDKALTALEIGKLEISVDLGGLEVFGDPMLEKVFYNMVDNTLRHGEKATKIAVTCRREGPNLLLVYEDDGAGVKPEEKERIFDRGFGKNTGLGLFLTKAILNVTHIEIKEQGEYGKGARFEMLIPDGMYRFREWDDA